MLPFLAAVLLTAGATIDGDLKGGEVHTYDVDLAAGTYFAARFDQRGIDIRAGVVGPDGSTVFDLDTREWGDEPVVLLASTGGRYRVEARALDPKLPRGHYVLHVDALRPATPADEAWASAMALQSRGFAVLKRGGRDNLLQARDLYTQALTAFRAVGNRVGEADAYTALGFMANQMDDFRAAFVFEQQDIELRSAIGDEYGETRAMFFHGRSLRTLGDTLGAIDLFESALARHKAAGRDGNAADVLGQLAISARISGDYGAAIEHGYEAVALSRKLGDPAREADALTSIGPIHLELGEVEQAIDAYRRARQLVPDDETVKALSDAQIGLALVRQGQFDAAEQMLNASLAVWTARGWRANESNTLRYFGELYVARGDDARAGDAFARAAVKSREAAFPIGEALALRQSAEALLRSGRLDEADRALSAAAATFPEGDDLAQAIVSTDQAKLALARGDLPAARARAEAAVHVVESLRGRASSSRIRSAMLASSQTSFATLIDVLMTQHAKEPDAGFDRMAFDVAERARARSLLELLLDDRVDAGGGSGPLAPLRDFHRRLNAKARALDDARRAKNDALSARLSRELDELTDQYGIAEAKVRRDSPEALGDAEPAPLDAIQHGVLDDRTVLIEFALGENASYAWTVTRSAVSAARLGPRRAIEAAARDVLDAIEHRRPSAGVLSQLQRLLLRPVGALPNGARLLIVAGGVLQHVPFAALPYGPLNEPLVARHEIVFEPSASVLAAVRAATGSRRQPARTAAVFADPVFDADDPRVKGAARAPAGDGVPGLPGSTLRGGLARLPFTRLEADSIAALVPRSSLLMATGFDASVKTVSTPAIADYRIVHFATHGVVDTRTPELSGLALSMIDREGRRQDGFLRMHDVSSLHLNADLVVLSGCETALGRSIEGEGVIGLTRGFVVAGASRVIASLWKVDDRATAELMTHLYRELLERHQPPAAALASAQRRLAASTQWRDPYFWAGLVIQGDWR